MSSGDFETELRQSVADNLALIGNAAKAAKARIGQSVAGVKPPAAEPDDFAGPRPAVNFDAEERSYPDELPGEGSVFDQTPDQNELPEGAISFDSFDSGDVDDDGIPVWEDPV